MVVSQIMKINLYVIYWVCFPINGDKNIMTKYDKITQHTVTLHVTPSQFKHVEILNIPKKWDYIGERNGTHQFVHKYKLDLAVVHLLQEVQHHPYVFCKNHMYHFYLFYF